MAAENSGLELQQWIAFENIFILFIIYLFLHLADTFIQSDLQMRTL